MSFNYCFLRCPWPDWNKLNGYSNICFLVKKIKEFCCSFKNKISDSINLYPHGTLSDNSKESKSIDKILFI